MTQRVLKTVEGAATGPLGVTIRTPATCKCFSEQGKEPGGYAAAHSDAGKPTLEYVMQGNVIEIRNGIETPHAQGEMVIATHDVSNWWENRGCSSGSLGSGRHL